MTDLDRRTFLQLSTGTLLAAASAELRGQTKPAQVTSGDGRIRVEGAGYLWEYSPADDLFHLFDSQKRLMASGPVQPAIIVASAGEPANRRCTPGRLTAHVAQEGSVRFGYEGVNGQSRVSITWRFEEHGIWTDPAVYESATAEDIVSLHYFGKGDGTAATPSLRATLLVIPGICESAAVSPIVNEGVFMNQTVWLGRGGSRGGLQQQWGLPAHFFGGFSITPPGQGMRDQFTEGTSDAFTCGLSDLPNGDLLMDLRGGGSSLWVNYRSDLWKHLRGPGRMTLGATLYWAIGKNSRESIGQYYEGLLRSDAVRPKTNSPRRTAVALTPQFCTWGAQATRGKAGSQMDEAFLTEIYEELNASGMKAGMLSIDEGWEGSYGSLEHSTERFPHFERFLDRVRADGRRIGMWAALMRCERPSEIGLTEENMLKRPDGSPYKASGGAYYILDCTQPEAADALAAACRRFIRRYKPDLVKFDFGYELPPVETGGPRDKSWAGERLMWKGLDVAINAMRQENPDLAVMYYQLSPLFNDYFDLHSPDDLYLNAGEYDVGANRRFYFSSILGRMGIPTYGSSGYDWASTPDIWFDSVAVGTLGSLNDFKRDERGEESTPGLIAKYNGLIQLLRTSNFFRIIPLGEVEGAPSRGAHARSWIRFEAGKPVLVAFRPRTPNDCNPLIFSRPNAWLEKAIHSSAPVVIASRGPESIGRAAELGIVPYGDGEISIRRQRGRHAEIISHYFGGSHVEARARIENGQLKLTPKQRNASSAPLEWIEVRIS